MRLRSKTSIIAATAALAVALTGCSAAGPAADDGVTRVVASTNVYGDIAAQIGGDLVDVTSIIDDPSQDPHSFEADARVQLALSKADLVIENGGGYDDFMGRLLSEAPDNLVTASAFAPGYDEPGFNEHVWFSLSAMQQLAESLASALGTIDPANADRFERNADAFQEELDALLARTAELQDEFAGASVAATEPVPGYLLEAMGLTDVTPADFSEAVEEGSEVSPAALNNMLKLLTSGTVAVLVVNDQTAGAELTALLAAAQTAGTPVVRVGETLPDTLDYQGWLAATIDDIEQAVREHTR